MKLNIMADFTLWLTQNRIKCLFLPWSFSYRRKKRRKDMRRGNKNRKKTSLRSNKIILPVSLKSYKKTL